MSPLVGTVPPCISPTGQVVVRSTVLLAPLELLTRILVMTTLSLTDIKARLSEIVDVVERHHERVVLTRNGVPAAVILSPEDLQALEDTLDLLSDPTALEEIRAARREVAAGDVVTADELRSRYLDR